MKEKDSNKYILSPYMGYFQVKSLIKGFESTQEQETCLRNSGIGDAPMELNKLAGGCANVGVGEPSR